MRRPRLVRGLLMFAEPVMGPIDQQKSGYGPADSTRVGVLNVSFNDFAFDDAIRRCRRTLHLSFHYPLIRSWRQPGAAAGTQHSHERDNSDDDHEDEEDCDNGIHDGRVPIRRHGVTRPCSPGVTSLAY